MERKMKANVYVEYADKQISEKDLIKMAKASWTKAGHKISEIKTLRLYVKPEDSAVYVVINDDFQSIVTL